MQTFKPQWHYAPLASYSTASGVAFNGDLVRVRTSHGRPVKPRTFGLQGGQVHLSGTWQYAIFLGLDLQRTDASASMWAFHLHQGGPYWQSREVAALLHYELVNDHQHLLQANLGLRQMLFYTRPIQGMELASLTSRRVVANPLEEVMVQNPYYVPAELAKNQPAYQARLAQITLNINRVKQLRNG